LLGETISSDNAAAFIAVERLRQADIEETQKAEQARQEALARQRERQSEPAYTRNIIEAYNAAHDIEELMQANGYIAGRSHNWRSPYQSGKSFATKVFGDYWVSLSDSDATAAIGRKCTSGRFGDAFDIYCHFEHGGDIAKALSQAALKLGMDNAHSQKPTKYTDTSQPHWETTKHPLAAYVEAECEQFVQEEFVLDGLLVAGAVLLAGAWGAGKTTQLVPLMCRAAHLCQSNDPLRPLLRRRVVYVTEDIEQVRRILRSMRLAGEFEGISREEVSDWFKLVQAVRMKPADIVTVAGEYAKLATDNVNDTNGRSHVAQAVVVLDTRSAVIAIDDENDNSEASAAIATFRQGMPTNPLVIVGHLAKTLTKSDVKSLSARGAGAWEADVQQVLYLCKEDEVRWLDVSTPKHRFISQVDGVEFQTHRTVAGGIDPLGNPVDIPLIHGVPTLVGLGQRQKTQAEQAELARKNRVTSLRREVLGAVTTAHYSGHPMNRQALKSKLKAKHADALDMLETLMQERWIAEIEIPKEQRTHQARKHHLIPLNEAQRRIWLETASPPDFTSRPTSESQTIPPVARHKNEIQTNEVLE
jgi:hypothetical protein